MPTTRLRAELDDAALAALREPRRDLLEERPDGTDAWVQDRGPFRRYRRTLTATAIDDGRHDVVEETRYATAIPIWGLAYDQLFRFALRDPDRRPRSRWWWPSDVIDTTTSTLIGVLGGLSVIAGYLGVLIGQTLTFAVDDFGGSDGDQGNFLAALRIGVVAGFLVIRFGDRFGRRPVLLTCAGGSIVFTLLGALSPGLGTLWVTQTIARGLDTALLTMIALAASEEVPAEVRALSISLQAMATGLGAGMVVWVLPLADVGPGWWRATYVAPALFLPLLWWLARRLPETRRFTSADRAAAPAAIPWRRFTLVATTTFLGGIFLSPASQLLNEFLRDERGFSASEISLYRLLISTPAGLVILVAGLVADRRGRKLVGAAGLGLGAVATVFQYRSDGAALWWFGLAGVWLSAAAYPALRGYQTELFPTRARARVGGWIDLVGVAGSALGLVIAGAWSDRAGTLATPITWLVVLPVVSALVILVGFPETARRELEEFNPSDPTPSR